MIMSNTARIQEVADLSIDVIKKAFIKRHQFQAANEQPLAMAATNNHIEAVKRWIAPLEFELNLKANVISCANPGMSEDAAAQVVGGELFILANTVHNEKQARDVFTYGSVGLIVIPKYLAKKGNSVIEQIHSGLTGDQMEALASTCGDIADKRSLIQLYLADLATLRVTPSFIERRESWQRQLVRKVYSGLAWKSNDLHYLIHRAVRSW
jgi:hypothetical protein